MFSSFQKKKIICFSSLSVCFVPEEQSNFWWGMLKCFLVAPLANLYQIPQKFRMFRFYNFIKCYWISFIFSPGDLVFAMCWKPHLLNSSYTSLHVYGYHTLNTLDTTYEIFWQLTYFYTNCRNVAMKVS